MLYVNLCWLVLIWSLLTLPVYLLAFHQLKNKIWLKWVIFILISCMFATIYIIYTSVVYSPLYWHVTVIIDLFVLAINVLSLIYALHQLINFVTTK